ncbi:MAG: UbiH/UbiF/VisC/COQ6 family ubiquinone biosynthesis hydroxylase [Rhodospirillales bacterium]|nr:UbiH/UbiF/VisC/COQ6 family ubiquinone biosynthesis hydroxylase [Rhodospirillales bacterium]
MTGIPQVQNRLAVDVLIAGGGFVGLALACALADTGLSTAVVEAEDPATALDPSFDGRASAIALTSQRLLAKLGVWELLVDTAAPMLDIRVSDGESRLFLHYDHRDVGDEPFGYMLENRLLRRALLERASAHPLIRLLAPMRIAALDRNEARIDVRLIDGRRVRASLAVAADGRGSRVRDEAGIRITRWAYPQTAIVTTVEHERSHAFIAHEHFLPAGPFAILPLRPETRSSIVWTERAALSAAILRRDDAGFTAELRRRFGDFLGEVRPVGPRFSYPLSLQYAARATGQRLALVGDALHAMHPIAGQGLNMGFRDVAALADVLGEASAAGHDLGTQVVLARYERWRRFDNTLMLAATDGLNRLFSNDIAPIRLARDLGLAVVNRAPPLKRLFMRHAMGLVGELPTRMRA